MENSFELNWNDPIKTEFFDDNFENISFDMTFENTDPNFNLTPPRKLSFLVKIESNPSPPIRLDVEVRTLEELYAVLSKKFGPISFVSYFDKDYNEFVNLERLETLKDFTRLQIHLVNPTQLPMAFNSSPTNTPISMPPLIPNPTNKKRENSLKSNSNDRIDFSRNDLSSPDPSGFTSTEYDNLENLSLTDEPVLITPVQVPVILTHLRHYQCSGDRNVTPELVVAVPRDLPNTQEIRATVIDAADNSEIEHGFSSGNVHAVNLKETVVLKSLKFGRKEHFPGSEIYKVYRIKISLPGTHFEPVYSNCFILLSNPTKQLKRAEVLDLAAKWNLNLQNPGHVAGQTKKRRQIKNPSISKEYKNVPESYGWSVVFDREVKTLITFEEFESSLTMFFLQNYQMTVPREIIQMIEYFMNNMPSKFLPEKPHHVSSIQWDLLLKFYGPPYAMIDKMKDVYQLSCFHGYMSSEEAKKALQGKYGYFLIRYSESEFGLGNYAVTVNRGKQGHDNIQHYATKHYPEENGFSFDDKIYYSMQIFILDHSNVLVHPLEREKNLDPTIRLERGPGGYDSFKSQMIEDNS